MSFLDHFVDFVFTWFAVPHGFWWVPVRMKYKLHVMANIVHTVFPYTPHCRYTDLIGFPKIPKFWNRVWIPKFCAFVRILSSKRPFSFSSLIAWENAYLKHDFLSWIFLCKITTFLCDFMNSFIVRTTAFKKIPLKLLCSSVGWAYSSLVCFS